MSVRPHEESTSPSSGSGLQRKNINIQYITYKCNGDRKQNKCGMTEKHDKLCNKTKRLLLIISTISANLQVGHL